jgi:photosystem II stability/assembly factor-like uncharacterized protein
MAPNPDIIYAIAGSTIFRSADAGAIWTETDFPPIQLRAIKAAPISQCQTTSATQENGEESHTVYVGTNIGIYKSEDGLETWSLLGPIGEKVNAIAVDPANPCILFLGTGDGIGKIFKSTDGGETWEQKYSYTEMKVILIDVDNSDYIYAGGHDGFFRSTDGGENWERITIGSRDPNEFSDLAMTPAGYSPKTIYAIGPPNNVYESTDQGDNWEDLGAPSALPLAVDPNNANVIYSGFYKSTDGGETWSEKASGLPEKRLLSDILIDPRNSAIYLGFNEGAVFKSTDGGDHWNFSSDGMTGGISIADLAVHPTSSDIAFAAVSGDGHHLARTTNGGASWEYLSEPATNLGAVTFYPQNPQTILAGDGLNLAFQFYVYKSTDGGQSWQDKVFFTFLVSRNYTHVTDILIKGDDPNSILVGRDFYTTSGNVISGKGEGGLHLTTDSGQTYPWKLLGFATTALAVDPNNMNVVYRGKRHIGQVFRYVGLWGDCTVGEVVQFLYDGGTRIGQVCTVTGTQGNCTVEEITPAGGIGDVRDIEVDSDSQVYVAASDGLWKWNGSDWAKTTGLPTDNIFAIAIDRSTNPEVIYLGAGGQGVFVSSDGGSTWMPFNQGLGNVSVTKVAISGSQPKILYAGTADDGVWSRKILAAGDVNGDANVGLDDAILAVQVCAGITQTSTVELGGDVNRDGNIGLADSIYILQKVSGVR